MILPSQPPLTDAPATPCPTDASAEPCLFCDEVIGPGMGRYRQKDGAVCIGCHEHGGSRAPD